MTQSILPKATQDFLKAKKLDMVQWSSQSPDLKPVEHAFQLPETKPNAERPTSKQHLKEETAFHDIMGSEPRVHGFM